ncbi:MAG: Cof-type HAD-IIB family hydrolase [Oscillospiraceae bacterium]|nr:Cof-type HAD-IIB family hydrolase [Oscillospiraceae bacterium]
MIKAAFFDIDGTLVSLKTKVYPASTKDALARLRASGVKCFVATGRSKFEIWSERLLDGLEFDGLLTNNGQDAYAADGSLLYGKPLDPREAAAVLDWVERNGCACWMVSAERSVLNCHNARVLQAMEAIHTRAPELGDLRDMLSKPIYKIVLFLTREEMPAVMPCAPTSRMTQWYACGHDIISADGGKRSAMLEVLRRYAITPQECIAFGDSENDVEMLRAAGIGVAMGNATPDCLAAADYVTADCDDDGLQKALEHFGLI